MNIGLFRMLLRPSRLGMNAVLLPAAGFTVVTTVTLGTMSIVLRLWAVPDNAFRAYALLGGALMVFLVVPLVSLVNAATRLSTRRRDDRLSTLRLLGASSGLLRRLGIAEMATIAALGILAGTLVYFATAPLLALIPLQGKTVLPGDAWLPWQAILGVTALVELLVVAIVVSGLRRVEVSPLEVRIHATPRGARVRELLVGIGVIIVGLVVMQLVGQNWGATGIAIGYVIALSAIMTAMNLTGPVLTSWIAWLRLRSATRLEHILASRSVLEDPKAAWRQVGPVGIATFIVVPAGSVLGYLNTIAMNSDAVGSAELMLFADFRTAAVIATVTAFLIVGCSVGITQAAEILDRRATYVALNRIGVSGDLMQSARRRAVWIPLSVAAIGAAALSTALMFMVVVISLASSPLFILGVVLLLVLGVLFVFAAVQATRPVLTRVLASPEQSL
ncbi:FtsX-like permease family protein [Zhihengliuella halotolerans]|uniref:FtsX-like permease family protein n=1 Tax=Zhihengliuella halotolerans TaxID=370736 RepID=A0A4Q8ABA0_9MICC|nr:FtsX-like permease family protein [Zhihengliuella halotolerans]RZU60931.1 FtsX-like permease family protein [Zhihengliuella halotolerans]